MIIEMNKCIICDIINNPQHLEDTILYENDLIIVKAAKGMVVPGHLLVIPKEHINGFAEMNKTDFSKVVKLCSDIKRKLSLITNQEVFIFEHGSLPEGRHPQSIVHAHIHIIPFSLNEYSKNYLIKECKMNKIKNIDDIRKYSKTDYWFYEDFEGNKYFSSNVENVPRSINFRIIASQLGMEDDYEWRDEKNNDYNKLYITFDIAKKIFTDKYNL